MIPAILLVDDDSAIAEGLAATLDAAGLPVIVCSDIEGAQLVVENLPLSMVISDIRLTNPFRFEGLDLAEHVRRHAPDTTVVLMTGVHSDELRAEAYRRGADAFLEKPFDFEQLEALMPLREQAS